MSKPENYQYSNFNNNRSIKLLSPLNSRSVECIIPQTKRSVYELIGTQTITRLPIRNQWTYELLSYTASRGWKNKGVLAKMLENFNISESDSPHYIALTNLRRKEGLKRIFTEVYEIEEPSIHSILIRLVLLVPLYRPDADSPKWESIPLTMSSDWTVAEVINKCEQKLKRESAVTRVNVDAIIDYSGFQTQEVNFSKLDCRLNLSEAVSRAFQVWGKLSLRQLVRGLGGDENHWRIVVQPVANLSSVRVIKKEEDRPDNRLEQVYKLINPHKLANMGLTILTAEQIALIKQRAKELRRQRTVVRSDDPGSVDKQL